MIALIWFSSCWQSLVPILAFKGRQNKPKFQRSRGKEEQWQFLPFTVFLLVVNCGYYLLALLNSLGMRQGWNGFEMSVCADATAQGYSRSQFWWIFFLNYQQDPFGAGRDILYCLTRSSRERRRWLGDVIELAMMESIYLCVWHQQDISPCSGPWNWIRIFCFRTSSSVDAIYFRKIGQAVENPTIMHNWLSILADACSTTSAASCCLSAAANYTNQEGGWLPSVSHIASELRLRREFQEGQPEGGGTCPNNLFIIFCSRVSVMIDKMPSILRFGFSLHVDFRQFTPSYIVSWNEILPALQDGWPALSFNSRRLMNAALWQYQTATTTTHVDRIHEGRRIRPKCTLILHTFLLRTFLLLGHKRRKATLGETGNKTHLSWIFSKLYCFMGRRAFKLLASV